MSSAPTSKFSRLSLEAMTPTTRSQALAGAASSPSATSHDSDGDFGSSSSSDSGGSDSETDSSTVRSPSKLTYRIDHLPERARDRIRDVFTDPPQLALQRCRLVNSTYAFQMTELVTRSVRITAPAESGDGASPLSCSCGGNRDGEPCEHLLWLLDRITEQTLYGHSRSSPLKMTTEGYPEEIDHPFRTIADHSLDVLGPGLHCAVVGSATSNSRGADVHRVYEARELLAAVHREAVDAFRPDIFDGVKNDTNVFKRGDLDITVLRMLIDNHHFFQYFLSAAGRSDTSLRDPFRKISQRVDRVLRAFDDTAFSGPQTSASSPSSPSTPRQPEQHRQQPLRDVRWAAKHLLGCTTLVRSSIFTRSRPLSSSEALSAARVLTHILELVVSRNIDTPKYNSPLSPSARPDIPTSTDSRINRNLYLHLIGDQDRDFVIGILGLLPPTATNHFLDRLEGCLDEIGIHGAPSGYVERFRKLLERLRTSSSTGLKRAGMTTGQEVGARGSKRMK